MIYKLICFNLSSRIISNIEDRKSIFSIHLKKKGQNPNDYSLDRLAKDTLGFNGAEIEECVNEAMFAAYTENQNSPKLQMMAYVSKRDLKQA